MGNDGEEPVSIALVAKIADQKGDSSVKNPLNVRRSALIASTKALGVGQLRRFKPSHWRYLRGWKHHRLHV